MAMRQGLSLRRDVRLWLSMLGVMPILIAAALLIALRYEEAIGQVRADLHAQTAISAALIEQQLAQHEAVLANAVGWLGAQSMDEQRSLDLLQDLREGHPLLMTVVLADQDGQLLAASPRNSADGVKDFWRGQSMADRDYFQRVRDSASGFRSELFEGRGYAQEWVLVLAQPMLDAQDRFLGVLQGAMDAAELERVLERLQPDRLGEVLVMDRQGRVIIAGRSSGLVRGQQLHAVHALQTSITEPGKMHTLSVGPVGAEAPMRVLARPLAGDWMVLAMTPDAKVYGLLRTRALILATLCLLVLCVVLVLVPIATRRAVQPVQRLAQAIASYDPLREQDLPAIDPGRMPEELRPVLDGIERLARRVRGAFDALDYALGRERELQVRLRESLDEREDEVTRRTAELHQAVLALRDESLTDALTGLANYRHYIEIKESLVAKAGAAPQILGAIAVDIDHFKAYNDRYGHPQGDECLRTVADCIAAALGDVPRVLARSGGEEFVALFEDVQPPALEAYAEAVRAGVESASIVHEDSPLGRVTVSVGIACQSSDAMEHAQILAREADLALYQAKRQGRNRVAWSKSDTSR